MAKMDFKWILLFFITNYLISQNSGYNFKVQNITNKSINEMVVELNWELLLNKIKKIDTTQLIVIDSKSKKQIPLQFELDEDKKIKNLLIQVSIEKNSIHNFILKKGKRELISTKTFGRYVPERKDDFAWENDKIAFRAYGKALEGTKENAYGYDVWVKRTKSMIINERYKTGNYHQDNGNGLDYYHVGLSLGAGNIALASNDSIKYFDNYAKYTILNNGPLRTNFILEYQSKKMGNQNIVLKKKISLDANSYLNFIENTFVADKNESTNVVVGIIKRKEKGMLSVDESNGKIIYWEPKHEKHGITGVSVFVPNNPVEFKIIDGQYILQSKNDSGKIFSYFAGACWDKEGKFFDHKTWNEYMNNFIEPQKMYKIIY